MIVDKLRVGSAVLTREVRLNSTRPCLLKDLTLSQPTHPTSVLLSRERSEVTGTSSLSASPTSQT
jgi:hypothetical protein